MLAWIFRRCDGEGEVRETPIGLVTPESIDTAGLGVDTTDMELLLDVAPEQWREQLPQVHEHFARFGDSLPGRLRDQLRALEERLEGAGTTA